jgi:hypothetical protein
MILRCLVWEFWRDIDQIQSLFYFIGNKLFSTFFNFLFFKLGGSKILSMQQENQLSLPEKILAVSNLIDQKNEEELRQKLVVLVNELINKDFHALVQLLYRIDVYEKKIRLYLDKNTDEDSAAIIADLIIERQLEKMESRKKFSQNKDQPSDEEKW